MFHVKHNGATHDERSEEMNESALRETLLRLEGRGYRDYKQAKGRYAFGDFDLELEYVQGDPFANPSRVRLFVPARTAALPGFALRSDDRRRAAADYVHRALYASFADQPIPGGSGRSGELDLARPGQQVLERSAVQLSASGELELRIGVGLPAKGRRILGEAAGRLLCDAVPAAVRTALEAVRAEEARLALHVETVEDAVALREQLSDRGLVAFVGDGSVLPRRSGVDDRPLVGAGVVAFEAPEALAVELHAPNAGRVRGLGVPGGVTLVVGGGYHGKSTLLNAIERGVYDHVPGDGRERVIADATAFKVRAEDGRAVAGTDISNFIGAIPGGGQSERFESVNASGSTSQAAAIVEALEAGATTLLLDEDTSAANFLIRDARMQRLIAAEDEPITAFVDRAGDLFERQGVSTIMVVGGSGDYFDVATTVIAMTRYRPSDVTQDAQEIARALPSARRSEAGPWREPAERIPDPESIDARDDRGRVQVRLRSGQRVLLGTDEVDLSALEQVVEPGQLEAMAWALVRGRGDAIDGRGTMGAAIQAMVADLDAMGVSIVRSEPVGNLSWFRGLELAAFLNRIRSLRTRPAGAGTRVARESRRPDD